MSPPVQNLPRNGQLREGAAVEHSGPGREKGGTKVTSRQHLSVLQSVEVVRDSVQDPRG